MNDDHSRKLSVNRQDSTDTTRDSSKRASEHRAVADWLPWYVNHSLSARDERRVTAHLGTCPDCQAEQERLQQFQKLVASEVTMVPDYHFSFNKLMRRIDDAERNRESVAMFEVKETPWQRWSRVSAWGLAAMLVIGVGSALLISQSESDGSELFQTLTTTSGNTGPVRRVALTFEQPIKAQALRKTLIETSSNIVSGPDESGVYIVEIPVAVSMADRAFIESIRSVEGVHDATLVP